MLALLPRLLAAALSGALLLLISAPLGQAWLHWVSFVPMFWALRAGEGRRNALLGYTTGWVGVFVCFFWLIETVVRFSSLPWVAGLAVHLLFASVFALPYAVVMGSVHWLRQRFGLAWVLLLPCVQVAAEKLSPALFPYYQGASQYRVEPVWQLVSVVGVFGISWLILLGNAAVAELIYRRREGRGLVGGLAPLGLWAGLMVANVVFGMARVERVEARLATAPVVRVAMLQQGVTMEERLVAPALTWLKSWVDQSKDAAPLNPDLVVWPEGAVPFNPHDTVPARSLGDRSPLEFFQAMASLNGFELLIGGGTYEEHPPDKYGRVFTGYNSVFFFDGSDDKPVRYDKMVPLPFGEYIPLSDTFPFLKSIVQGPGDFQAGTEAVVFTGHTVAGHPYTFTVPICYEAILEDQMAVLSEVDLFVNITNDAWFGDTTAPHQHAMLAAVQAVQYGRPMLRVAYTGINMVVEPHGRILYETKPFTDSVQVEEVRLGGAPTLFARGGWIFAWLCVLVSLAAFLLGRAREPILRRQT